MNLRGIIKLGFAFFQDRIKPLSWKNTEDSFLGKLYVAYLLTIDSRG